MIRLDTFDESNQWIDYWGNYMSWADRKVKRLSEFGARLDNDTGEIVFKNQEDAINFLWRFKLGIG